MSDETAGSSKCDMPPPPPPQPEPTKDGPSSSDAKGTAEEESAAVVFKRLKRKRHLRTTKIDDDDDNNNDAAVAGTPGGEGDKTAAAQVERSLMADTRELQKLRMRPHGVSVASLGAGKPIPVSIVEKSSDPYKMETGGLVEMQTIKKDTINIGNQFASETNERDEDADMMKYIEEELKKRKGDAGTVEETPKHLSLKNEDLLMQILPKHLKQAGGAKSEEMLSNQMLAGIPEVDLGIDERIRNIEATEEAKMRMLREKMRTAPKPESMAPVNFSVNFTQQQEARRPRVHRDHQHYREPGQPLRASDDLRVERFKKHFSRR